MRAIEAEVAVLNKPYISKDKQPWFLLSSQGTWVMKFFSARVVEESCAVTLQNKWQHGNSQNWSYREADMGPGPAVLPTGFSCRPTPKSPSGNLYASEPKWWFTDTRCNVRFISVEAIIARVVWEACHALDPNVSLQHLLYKNSPCVRSLSL